MKYKAQAFALALAPVFFSAHIHAATVNNGDKLSITAGSQTVVSNVITAVSGSWFGMDNDGNGKISLGERTLLSQGSDGGLIIGVAQDTNGHASHGGRQDPGVGGIDAEWFFFSNSGMDFTSVAVTGDTVAGLNLSGWTVTWNGIPAISMGAGAWQPLNCSAIGCSGHTFTNGNAQFVWNGTYGNAYTLNYAATVPPGDPSGFGGVKYYLHLEGTVEQVGAVTATLTSPTAGSTGVPITSAVTIQFSEAMRPATVNSTSVVIAPTAGGAAVSHTCAAASGDIQFTCTPSSVFASGTSYTVTVNSGAKTAASGAAVGSPRSFSFTTAAPPTVSSVSPVNNATGVSLGATINVTFVNAVDPATVTASTFKVLQTASGAAVSCTFTNSANKTFICTPSTALAGNTDYTVQLTTGIRDASGIAMTAPYSWVFRTASGLARPLGVGDVLTICPGSRFGMEQNPGVITTTSLEMANGIKIGVLQPALGSHTGAPNGSETPGIDKPWNFFNNTGMHFTSTPITSIDGTTLSFSGWRVTWNAIPSIDMGGAQANFPQDTGKASLSWDGTDGGAYTLDYAAHVPLGDPSGFGGVPYTLHLVGRVNTASVQAPCEVKPTTAEGVEITVNKGIVTPSSITSILPSGAGLAAAGLSEAGRPSDLDFYQYRLMSYTITGLAADGSDEVTITLIFPSEIPAGSKLYKVSASGFTLIADAVFSGRNATFKIKDNGPFDANMTNGVIADPVALGTPLPTLQPSGGPGGGCTIGSADGPGESMFALLLLLVTFNRMKAYYYSRRRG